MGEAVGLPPEREGVAAPPDLVAMREGLDAAIDAGLFRISPPPQAIVLGGVDALRFPPDGLSTGTILHFHGGGFRLGRPEQLAAFAAALAARSGMTVVCPRYRLAPEHPFPAALNDAGAAWRALRDTDAGRIVVSGDSAGGGIAAGLVALAGDAADPPAALILLSAWLDLTVTSPAFEAHAVSDPLFSRAAALDAVALYLRDTPPDHPLASPGLGRVDRFPPTFINVGDREVLFDDSRNLHARLLAAGVATRLHVVPGMQHVAVTRGAALAGAAETLDAIVTFLARSR